MTVRTFPVVQALAREMERRSSELFDLVANAAAAIHQPIAAVNLSAGRRNDPRHRKLRAEDIPRDKRLPITMAVLHPLNDCMLARGIV